MQFSSHLNIALNGLVAGGSETEILRNLHESIQKCEEMHDFLRVKDQFKISFFLMSMCPLTYFFVGCLLLEVVFMKLFTLPSSDGPEH